MKTLTLPRIFFPGAVLWLALAAAVPATDIVGISMTTGAGSPNLMAAADLAGAPGARNGCWNNAIGAGTLPAGTLTNQSGAVVAGLAVSITTSNNFSQRAVGTSNDTKMFGDDIDHVPQNSPTIIRVTGIPYTNYNVYFYEYDTEYGSGATNTRGGYFAMTNSVNPVPVLRYMRNQDNSYNQLPPVDSSGNGYVPSTTSVIAATDTWDSVQGGNYVKFTGLTNSDFTAIIGTIGGSAANKDILGRCITNGNGTARLKFSGFQIQQAGSPGWNTNPVALPAATQNQPYTNTLANSATPPPGGSLAFSKAGGPAWLAVAANGGLSGTPGAGDVGTNSFTVRVTDASTLTNDATLLINVQPVGVNSAPVQLASPDGRLLLTFVVSNFDGTAGCPIYSVTETGRTLIAFSKLGLTFGTGLLGAYLTNVSQVFSSSNSVWQPVYGERSTVTNNYNQLTVNLQEAVWPSRLLQLTFRAYNEGAAFCYTIPAQAGLAGASNLTEQTEFRFDGNYPAWTTTAAQGIYSSNTLGGVPAGCERPLPVQLATNLFVALGEARLVDYSRMKFAPLSGETNSLVSLLDGPVNSALPLTTPWRFILAGASPGQLLENNFLVLNLNDPCALTNTDWIKPGKVIRETTVTTNGGYACVNFAVKHRLQYFEYDAGWYGPESTTLDATQPKAGLDLPGVINYANSNGVGVILYVNWLAMTNQLNILPPLYQSWGVKGIKYGFVGPNSAIGQQTPNAIVNQAMRLCATNRIMCDVHDEFRPSGYTRTYPNMMTVEGILGDEGTPTAAQDTTELFSRMLAGGADHTVCYFDARVTNNWSCAYQLAKAVCFYSPWQFLYWYDIPTNSPGYVSGGNDKINDVPELEFYDYLPTVWDETRVLQSCIGQYAVIARRTGDDWFIGVMNANTNYTFTVPLDFLTPGQKYIENFYSQDPNVPTRTQVRIDRSVVDSTAIISTTLAVSSGVAVRLTPAIPPVAQSLSLSAKGGFSLISSGHLGATYSLHASTNLALPATNWTLLAGTNLVSSSPFTNSDMTATNQRQRFYRFSAP